ncbi:MAG: hypothetical protein V7709_13755 [Halioglobus sp.]
MFILRYFLEEAEPISDSFDFLMVLYSIIVGIGMGQILMAVGQILQAEKVIRVYWIHTAWVLLILLSHILMWFGAWEYRAIETWNFYQFLSFLMVPALLYIASVIAFPDMSQERDFDLRDYYYTRYGWLHALLALVIALLSINEFIMLDHSVFVLQNAIKGLALLVLLIGFLSRQPKVHATQIVIIYGLLAFFAWDFRGIAG